MWYASKYMKTLRQYIDEARASGTAIGHFNISNLEALWGIVSASKALQLPVIIGLSEGEEDAVGIDQAVALVRSFREVHGLPVFLNADHHYSFERVKKAIDAGVDMVIVDGAALSMEDNITLTKECVLYARQSGRDVLVEGELGYIGQSSKMLDAVPDGVSLESLTTPEDAEEFVLATGVDLLAPAVGNIHGMLHGGVNPRLDIDRIAQIQEASGVPLVLHGGSGNEADFAQAIDAGITIVHINTEIRKAYTDALRAHLSQHPDDIAPYKYTQGAREAVESVVYERLKTFARME